MSRPLFWLLNRLKWASCQLIDKTICHGFVLISPRCWLYRWQSLFDIIDRLAFLWTEWSNRDDVVIGFRVVTCVHCLEKLFATFVFWTSSISLSPRASSPGRVRVRFRWRSGFLKFESVSTHPERFFCGAWLAVIGPVQGESLRVFGLLVPGHIYVGVQWIASHSSLSRWVEQKFILNVALV